MERYKTFSSYLKAMFGTRVHRITIDAGFSCPHRESRKQGGCIYCYRGSSYDEEKSNLSIKEQIIKGMNFARKRFGAKKFLAYFQSYTNTFAPVETLKKSYDQVLNFKDIAGIIIGTRPDCISDEILELINSYTDRYLVWIEYGLESSHYKSLRWMKRGHGVSDFVNAVTKTKKYPRINICSHIILGLPTEDTDDMLETADFLSAIKVNGVKLHPLHVIKNTELAEIYAKKPFKLMNIEEYAVLVRRFLERLHPDIVVQRVTGEAPENLLVAPYWCSSKYKTKVINFIRQEMENKNSMQGIKCRFA